MNDVSLSRLTHDIVQNTYKEMHALLDSLGDLPPENRREKLIDFTLKMRHRFARLLVALRWFMSYSAFHGSASATRQIASARSMAFTTGADTLFAVSGVARGAAAQPSAVQEAAEILGASSFFGRIPRVIETAIGLDKSASINDLDSSDSEATGAENDITSEAIERLGVSTRYVVQSSLPSGVVVINPAVPPNNAAIRIGVPGAWTADLILDRLQLEQALLILLRFKILVGPHPDALSPLQNPRRSSDQPLALRKEKSEPLRQMIEDRMRWVSIDSDATDDKKNRMKNVLLCLSKAMSFECAGKIAMDHVRAQALALIYHSSWKSTGLSLSGVGSEAADNVPVQIRYWPSSYMKATLRISMPKEDEMHESETSLVIVRHDPELAEKDTSQEISLQNVFVESVLLDACRSRAEIELRRIQDFCNSEFPAISTKVVSLGQSSSSLVISFDSKTQGLSIGVSLRNGGYFVRSHGTVSLALTRPETFAEELQCELWQGFRYFPKGLSAIKNALTDLIKKTTSLLSSYSAVECSYAIDGGVIPHWPPGAASVEKPERTVGKRRIKPPLMSIDRKRPRRFLTLQSVAGAHDEVRFHPGISVSKRARSLPMHYSVSSEEALFIEGRRPEGVGLLARTSQVQSDAVSMADWAEIRHAADLRIKRDTILQHLEKSRIATVKESDYSLKSTECSLLTVKTSPMEVEKAVLLLLGNDGWKIQLTLTNNIFDSEECVGRVVKYSSENRLLTFSYPDVSAVSVSSFGLDLMRARTAAALLQGISNSSKHYSILRKSPLFIELDLKPYNMRMTVGFGTKEIEVEVSPPLSLIRNQLVPLIEEVLHSSGRKMGYSLDGMLELAIPLGKALVRSVPEHPSYAVKFSTALHARVSISHKPSRRVFGIDIDARGGFHAVVVIDVSRLAKIQKSKSSHYSDIPIWDSLVEKVAQKKLGTSIIRGSALKFEMPLLNGVLTALVRGLKPQVPASSAN